MRSSRVIVLAICALIAGPPAVAQAASIQTFTTSQSEFTNGFRNQGWWSTTHANEDFNDNYFVGTEALGQTHVLRNFFTFDLSSACPASAVTLQVTRFLQTGPLTYSLFDVSTPAPTLNANNGVSAAIFADLGTGVSFGSFPVTPGDQSDLLSFPLNAAGVAAFNAARGGFFSIGGSIGAGEGSFGDNFIYGNSNSFFGGTQQLLVTCLPERTEECKSGGWRNFGVFRNQGDCVSFVATGGRNQPAGPST